MKKRWLSLFLCLVMVLSVFLTGCSEKTDDDVMADTSEDASESAITLTMWIVCEEEVSPEAYARISNAINSITKSKFKTQLVLRYFTEDQYRAELENAIRNFKGEAGGVEENAPDEYEKNDAGLSVIKYPEVLANQVDIVYIAGQNMYFDFIENEWLAPLDAELNSTAKTIKEYVSSTLLSAAKYNGATYAIPNNRPVGQYNYMLLNKELMQKYAQDAYIKLGMIDGLFNENLYPFLNLVDLMERDSVIPIDATYEDCLNLLAYYWNISSEDYSISDLQKFSLFGYHYQNIDELSRGSVVLGYNSLFADEEFARDYLKINEFRFKEYFRAENDTRTQAAVKFMTGDSTILNQKDEDGLACYVDGNGVEYYPVVVGYPTATADDIYGNMFGVYTAARSVSRAMDIVAYLNTNADFRNLLQYGVEDVDYRVLKDEKGNFIAVESLGTGYNMDIWATGNTFIAYPDTEAGLDVDIWENGKVQNRDSLVSPLLGFDFPSFSLSTGEAEEEEEINSKNRFNLSYSTGHTKSLLAAQNEQLAQWLEGCDAAGKGVYVLQTKLVTEDGDRYNYFVYNNNVTAPVQVVVTGVPEKEVGTNGKEETVAANFTLSYVEATGESLTPGYEITCISVYAKTDLPCALDVGYTRPDPEDSKKTVFEDANAQYSNTDAWIAIDFFNTADYSIEVIGPLYKTDLERNADLQAWLLKFPFQTGKKETNVLQYREGDEVRLVVYRTTNKDETELAVHPLGDAKDLVLSLDFSETSESKSDYEYVLYYVRVKLNSEDVNVTYRQTINGKAATLAPSLDMPIDLDFYGQLDTGLIKFTEKLNAKMLAILDECYAEGMELIREAKTEAEREAAIETAIANYEALVKEFGKLLDPEYEFKKAPAFITSNYPILISKLNLSSDLGISNVNTLLENVKALTTSSVLKKPDRVDNGGVTSPATDDRGELYEYRAAYSPYAMYYEWLKQFGFLPKE